MPNSNDEALGTAACCFSVAVKSSSASRIASRSSAEALCSAESAVGTCLHMPQHRPIQQNMPGGRLSCMVWQPPMSAQKRLALCCARMHARKLPSAIMHAQVSNAHVPAHVPHLCFSRKWLDVSRRLSALRNAARLLLGPASMVASTCTTCPNQASNPDSCIPKQAHNQSQDHSCHFVMPAL